MQTAPRARSTTLLLSLMVCGAALPGLSSCSADKQPPAQQTTAQPSALSKLPSNAPDGSTPIASTPPPTVTPPRPPPVQPRAPPAAPTPTPVAELPTPPEPLPNIPADAQ